MLAKRELYTVGVCRGSQRLADWVASLSGLNPQA